jgi:Holliday junction resolvase RusA-like endonuclease
VKPISEKEGNINLTKDDENNYKRIFKKDIRGKTPKAYSTTGVEKWGEFVKQQIGPNFKNEINNSFGKDLDKNKYSFKVNMKFFFGEEDFRKSDLDNVAKELLDIIFKSRDGENTGLLLDFDDRVVDEINVKRVFVENKEDEGVYFEIYYKLKS